MAYPTGMGTQDLSSLGDSLLRSSSFQQSSLLLDCLSVWRRAFLDTYDGPILNDLANIVQSPLAHRERSH
jgi:hypothetical protein